MGFFSKLLSLLQRFDGVPDVRIKPGATRVEMGKYLLAHPGIPELFDVFGDARHGLVVALILALNT